MKSIAVMAVPDQGEEVWDVSSEKVPHVTILYLPAPDSPEIFRAIVEFVKTTTLRLPDEIDVRVDKRGTLGEEEADVLFLNKLDCAILETFRDILLEHPAIKELYTKDKQFPEWTPHMTMGYPDTPAKSTDVKIDSVELSQIGVWTGEYDGPIFDMGDDIDEDDDDITVEVEHNQKEDGGSIMHTLTRPTDAEMEEMFLAHAGVKGMKWGVRKRSASIREGHRNRAKLRADNMIEVSKGNATLPGKAMAYGQLSLSDIARSAKRTGSLKGSVKAAAGHKGQQRMDRIKRVEKGTATVRDKIAYMGTTPLHSMTYGQAALKYNKENRPKG